MRTPNDPKPLSSHPVAQLVADTTKLPECPKCRYQWVSRVAEPKACPRCKARMDA